MKEKVVLIGASTGGPGHLKNLLIDLPSELKVPIVIAQHMGDLFIPSFVDHFNNIIAPDVKQVDQEETLDGGGVYICKKNSIISSTNPLRIKEMDNVVTLYNPNVNVLFESAAILCHKVDVLAMLLTGIGDDGAVGLANIASSGGEVYGESEESAVVYGMPKKAKEFNPKLTMLGIDELKERLERFVDVV